MTDLNTTNPDSPEGTTVSSRRGKDRRLAFIDFRLRWDGRFNRSDLTDYFGISIPQASLDISRYMEMAPQNLIYDRSSRAYLTTDAFRPLFKDTNPYRYLSELLASTAGILEPGASFIGWHPPLDSVPQPGREVGPLVLTTLLMAIREVSGLKIIYQSMSHPEPSVRTISPHAFVFDGLRWHVRAFCHRRGDFRDFVLGRVLDVQETEPVGQTVCNDDSWNNILTLVLAPHPDLSAGKRRAIEIDYGMSNGEVELQCRQALLFYTLKRLGFDHRGIQSTEAQQIVLKNELEIAPFVALGTSAT